VNLFELARRALADLQHIWEYIAEDSFDAADRVLDDFHQAFEQLAKMPGIGHKRPDLTDRDVLFWPVHSYLVIYKGSKPLRIVRVIHGKRNVKMLLDKR
jgi:plasmid stabilization system protein ParE